mgnify:CR=1 FL=1
MDKTNCLISIHCTGCGKKLAEAKIKEGKLSIKCRCGVENTIESKIILRASRTPQVQK